MQDVLFRPAYIASALTAWRPTITWALAGPLCLGAVAGLRGPSISGLLRPAVGLPLVVVGTTILMAPALYLLLSLLQAPTSGVQLARRLLVALGAAGQVHLGLGPAVLFLAVTTVRSNTGMLFGLAAFATGVLVGLHRLVRELWQDAPDGGRPSIIVALAPWCGAALVVGARLTWDLLVDGGPGVSP